MAKFATVFLVAFLASATLAAPSSNKIQSSLQASLKSKNNVDILISFQGGNNEATLRTLKTKSFTSRASLAMAVRETLKARADSYQSEVLDFLGARSNQVEKIEQLWVSNQVYVRGAPAQLVAAIAEFSKVTEIKEDERIPLNYIYEGEGKSPKDAGILAEWGVENVRAPAVWSAGNTGAGAIISTIDTGVRYTHEVLRNNYVGTANGGWLDPYTNSANPIDQNGHGTHTTGTIAGANGIGVAPGARWSACRGCDTSSCSTSSLLSCGQWTVCPSAPAPCTNIPDVSSNSWGGGRGNNFFDDAVRAMKAVGVVVVFSNGNSGSACNTANSPADSAAGVIGVGSITSANALSSFSSKGPSIFGTIKPDISGPGSSVNSAYHTSDTAYSVLSGTSMSCPHVSGVVALLRSRSENISYDQVLTTLRSSANTQVTPTGQNCGGISDSVFPNHSYGAGRVDAFAAFQAPLP